MSSGACAQLGALVLLSLLQSPRLLGHPCVPVCTPDTLPWVPSSPLGPGANHNIVRVFKGMRR